MYTLVTQLKQEEPQFCREQIILFDNVNLVAQFCTQLKQLLQVAGAFAFLNLLKQVIIEEREILALVWVFLIVPATAVNSFPAASAQAVVSLVERFFTIVSATSWLVFSSIPSTVTNNNCSFPLALLIV